MSALNTNCVRAGGLTSLSSFTFTSQPNCLTNGWIDSMVSLLNDSPLETVHLNATDLFHDKGVAGTLGNSLCMKIVEQHRDHLTHFSLHGLQLSLPLINFICIQCARLEQLFICVDHNITDMVCFLFFGSLTVADVQIVRHPLPRHSCERIICVRYISNTMSDQSTAVPTTTRWTLLVGAVRPYPR